MRYDFSYLGNTHAVSRIDITGSPAGERQVNFNYDDFGNMITKQLIADSGNKTTNFVYDDANKLKHIDLPDEIFKLDFKYSNGGQRITKTYSDNIGVVNHNVYVNGFYDITNGVINKHISDGKYIFATKVDNDDNNILYYSQNNIGSTVMLTDKDSVKVQGYLYQPFGEMWVEENPSATIPEVVRLFTGQMYDKESGLYYMNARYYDPHLGTFITADPGMDGYNHYAYCHGNPITYSDPNGLSDRDFEGGIIYNLTYNEVVFAVSLDGNGNVVALFPGENLRSKGMKDADIAVFKGDYIHIGFTRVSIFAKGVSISIKGFGILDIINPHKANKKEIKQSKELMKNL